MARLYNGWVILTQRWFDEVHRDAEDLYEAHRESFGRISTEDITAWYVSRRPLAKLRGCVPYSSTRMRNRAARDTLREGVELLTSK